MSNKKPTWLDVYYDRSFRSWAIIPRDEDNNQVADSSYVYSKAESLVVEKNCIDYYDIDPKHNKMKQRQYKKYLKSL